MMLALLEPVRPRSVQERLCAVCDAPLLRMVGEKPRHFQQRIVCGEPCRILNLGVGDAWRRTFPGAQYRDWQQVPGACECGGSFVHVEDGVKCLMCGDSRVVAAALVRYLLQQFRNASRRPVVIRKGLADRT